ncbi:hypothetical protein B0H16DRAFT_1596561 [Mycena metata]|uniref:Uncharacterized protein n=1 Tax=Mycena metata TaxID=1033252 RepID=A0AAD7MN35_9AGAR|nr:hypothetical protein B0H16DRAFT_1596561 [Mycena metata]
MLLKLVATFLALASAIAAVGSAKAPPVFTVTREYKTLTDVAPYIITATTTMTWTQSPTSTFAHATGSGLPA